MTNGTWKLVSYHDTTDYIQMKWIYRTKLKSDGLLDKYKARLMAKGYDQVKGIDYTKTFFSTFKP